MNVWQARYDDYLIDQCAMLYDLEPGLQKWFERHRAYKMFQEKTKLKDDGSNNADWVHDLRIILIVAQKNYVLDAPLADIPTA